MNLAMATFTSRDVCIFYIHILLFYSLQPPVTAGTYFKLTSGTDTEISAGNTSPIIKQEFFECSMRQTCTHVLRIGSGFVAVHGIGELSQKQHKAECIYEKIKILGKAKLASSCLDFYRDGTRRNGQYDIVDQAGTPFKVFCDFESEDSLAWTLVASFSLLNKSLFQDPFFKDRPRNESNPNWVNYR